MKYTLLVICLYFFEYADCQSTNLKLEGYAAPGFFFEQLNKDSLIPPARRNHSRLGDVASFGAQINLPLKNERWLVKSGIGFSQRHYSLNKYSLDDFFLAVFSFGLASRRDSFYLSYVRFTNNYLQVPVSAAYVLNKNNHNLQASVGLNVRADFLLKSNAEIRFDSTYKIPQQTDIDIAQKIYTQNASKFVLTIEPYFETSFRIYKRAGGLIQFRPFSFYSSRLNERFTSYSFELLSFTFGVSYSLK